MVVVPNQLAIWYNAHFVLDPHSGGLRDDGLSWIWWGNILTGVYARGNFDFRHQWFVREHLYRRVGRALHAEEVMWMR